MNIDELIKKATLSKNGAAKEAYRAIKAELLLNNSSKIGESFSIKDYKNLSQSFLSGIK